MIKQNWNWALNHWQRKGGHETAQASVFSCPLAGITLQMQHPPGLFGSVRGKNSEKMNVVSAYLTSPTEGRCTALCFTLMFCLVLGLSRVTSAQLSPQNSMGSTKVKHLLLKNAVSVLVARRTPILLQGWVSWSYIVPVVSMSDTRQCLSSLLEQIPIGIPRGKRECCQPCSFLQGLLQTDRLDVEDTNCISFDKDNASALFQVRQ